MDQRPEDYDEPLPSPDAALALIRDQQRSVERDQLGGLPWVLVMWGVAWGLGFLALWSGYDGGNPWFQLPLPVAGTVAPFFGAPTNNLVMALLGGGPFLVAAVVMQVSLKRGRG